MSQHHPKPFSSDWLTGVAPVPRSPRGIVARQRVVSFFSRFPGERRLALLMVLTIVVWSLSVGPSTPATQPTTDAPLVAEVPDAPQLKFAAAKPTVEPSISTDSLQVTDQQDVQQVTIPVLNLQPAEEKAQPLTVGGILPNNRILAFYGFPGNPEMGILGEYDMQRLLELMREQAAEYEKADPAHPVTIAFEVIASVAQPDPQDDGSYLLDTPAAVLNDYANFTRENGILLILDAQIGRRTVEQDVSGLRPWLIQDHVHLAIDPEFAMKPGEQPGKVFGSVDAIDVQWAQQYLIDLANDEGISPKLLIVHQFIESMITNKTQISPMSGVQLVIDADGWGPPDQKWATYDFVNRVVPLEYAGIKLFYGLDNPLMTPEQVLALDPAPLYVMYQ